MQVLLENIHIVSNQASTNEQRSQAQTFLIDFQNRILFLNNSDLTLIINLFDTTNDLPAVSYALLLVDALISGSNDALLVLGIVTKVCDSLIIKDPNQVKELLFNFIDHKF